MALTPKNAQATPAVFEDMDDAPAAPAATTSAPAPAATASAASTTTVAVQPQRAVAGFRGVENVVASLKDAVRVNYDTLANLIATNGNFVERETKKVLGDTVVFELMSWQASYVVQPGDDKAPKECVRYSDDAIVCSDGTLVRDHLDSLREMGYDKASVKERAVVVGSLTSASKTAEYNDQLVQFDLSPKSRASFARYQLMAMNYQRLGKATAEQVLQVKATTRLATAGNNTYTVVDFNINM